MANASAALTGSAESAKAPSNRLDGLSDRISPIVVKEVRQMMRGKEFYYSFMISLFAGLIIAFVTVANSTGMTTSGTGTFSALMFCLLLVGMLVSPLGAFNMLRNERQEQTLDLVTITSLSARHIVIGKLAAQAVKLTVLYAALAPFVVMSFLLGGIDFLTIVLSLGILFVWSLWASAAALFLSSLSKSRAVSSFIFGAIVVLFLFVLFNAGSGLILMFTRGTSGGSSFTFGSGPNLLQVFAIANSIAIISGINLILLAENRLLQKTEDRSFALRIGFGVQFLAIISLCIYAYIHSPGMSSSNRAMMLCVLGGLHLAGIALFSVTERFELPLRARLRLRTARLRRSLVFLHPGGSGAAVYVLILMALMLAAGAAFIPVRDRNFYLLVALCGYICFLTGVPTLLVRIFNPPRIRTIQLRIGIVLFLFVMVFLPDFLAYIATGNFGGKYSARHVFNPFYTISEWRKEYLQEYQILIFGIGLIGLVSYLVLIKMGWQRITHETEH